MTFARGKEEQKDFVKEVRDLKVEEKAEEEKRRVVRNQLEDMRRNSKSAKCATTPIRTTRSRTGLIGSVGGASTQSVFYTTGIVYNIYHLYTEWILLLRNKSRVSTDCINN